MEKFNSSAACYPKQTLVAACLFNMCAALAGMAATDTYAPPPFGHYQPILDRMPFGALPANFGQAPVDPAAAQTAAQVQAEQQKLAKQVNMSAVNITPEGKTAIGFTDLSAKPPVNYYLTVGSSADGWTVISADYDDEIASLEKDGITITLQLGKGLVDPANLPAKTGGPSLQPASATSFAKALPRSGAAPMIPGLQRQGGPATSASMRGNYTIGMPPPTSAAIPAAPEGKDGISSYKERLLERNTQKTEAEMAAAKKQQEQLVKLAREAALKEIARREAEAAPAPADMEAAAPAEQPAEAQPQQEAPQPEGTVP